MNWLKMTIRQHSPGAGGAAVPDSPAMNTRRRGALVATAIAALYIVAIVVVVSAATTHVTTGTTGTHSSSTHYINPGHLAVKIGSPHAGSITSGGRYHDSCASTVCYPAFTGDYALDIAAAGGTAAKLYLDFHAVGLNPDPNIDLSEDIRIRAKVLDAGGTSACQWQKYAVLVTYWGTNGTQYVDKSIGYVWLMHHTNWSYAVNDIISPNATKTIPGGAGTLSYINGVQVSTVYNGSGSCSTGPHTHLEVFSRHSWGGEIEWHSSSGPDGYSGLYGYSDHIHYGTGYSHSPASDSVSAGLKLAQIGGGRTSFRMMDNPNYGDH